MKRTDITELFPEASKEAIDKLMAMNGADVNAKKAELDGLREQLAEAQKFQTAGADLEKAKQQISQLNAELDGLRRAETIRITREKVAGEKKVPISLLTGETEEDCAAQADAILAFAKPSGYPNIPDGGETTPPSSGSTRERFAEFMTGKI